MVAKPPFTVGIFPYSIIGTVIALFMDNCKIQGKGLIMPEKNMRDRRLCSNCKNDPDCTFKKNRQKPSFYCEEFKVDTCPSVKTTRKDKSEITSVDAKDEDSSKFIGLCSNCDNRKTCTFPKPEGGLWHCEEYK